MVLCLGSQKKRVPWCLPCSGQPPGPASFLAGPTRRPGCSYQTVRETPGGTRGFSPGFSGRARELCWACLGFYLGFYLPRGNFLSRFLVPFCKGISPPCPALWVGAGGGWGRDSARCVLGDRSRPRALASCEDQGGVGRGSGVWEPDCQVLESTRLPASCSLKCLHLRVNPSLPRGLGSLPVP